jgi:hypothetical protein
LEPITVFENVPILVVTGYMLYGYPEQPGSYVDYCLKDCRWRDAKYDTVPPQKRKEIVEKLITAKPKAKDDADWLRQQAE